LFIKSILCLDFRALNTSPLS